MMGESFGGSLKHIRKERGMTLEEMAKFLDTTKQALSRYERGDRTPKITVAWDIAEKLGVDLSDMIGYEPEMEEPAAVYFRDMQENHECELMEFCELFVNMNPRQQKTVMKMIRTIAEDDDE